MKIIPIPIAIRLFALGALAAPALAQPTPDDHASHHLAATASASTADLTDGEIRKIDKAAKKLTIKHGEIKNLGMPPMTMVFQVKDASLLDQVKAGDKIRFVVQQSESGFVVTDIQAAK